MVRARFATLALCAAAILAAGAPAPAGGQAVLDRTPNLSGGWVGVPWALHVELPHRFRDAGAGAGLHATTTFTGALGLPHRSLAGLRYAIASPTAPGDPDEVEAFARHRLLRQEAGFADVALTAGWNFAAGSVDAEAAVARWMGPLRVMGAARWLSDARGLGEDRLALAGGAVWHPFPRDAPIALAADVAAPMDRAAGELMAWSAGVQVGIPHTALTLSLQASNAAATTLQGTSFGTGTTHYGFELTVPVPAGFFLGRYPERADAMEAVVEEPGGAADVVIDIRRYAYGPTRIVVPRGSVVRWVNSDDVVHTATAEDGAWDSGAIRPGESWSARFDEPGTYPYLCAPHPFMKAAVIVR